MSSTPYLTEREFTDDLNVAFLRIRGALTEVLTQMGASAHAATDLARQLHLNKTLAWKVSRIVRSTQPLAAIQHIPTAGSADILIDACARAGAPSAAVSDLRSALEAFETMVGRHAGDHTTFDLMLSNLADEDSLRDLAEDARRRAFEGNSAIWGLQGRLRLASFFLAPNAAGGGLLDFALIGGLLDVRRLRPNVSVPMFEAHLWNDDGSPRAVNRQAITPSGADEHTLHLMDEYCSSPLPALRAERLPCATRFHLEPGPVGNTRRSSWVFGWFDRGFAPMYKDEANQVGEHAVNNFVPVELLLCDLLVHRSLSFAMHPEAVVYGQLGMSAGTASSRESLRLPIAERVEDIGHCPPVMATPLVPRYVEMVRTVYNCCGWDERDFHGFRFILRYAPIPTLVVLRHALADPP